MKVFTIIFTLLAIALIIYNSTMINWDAPFQDENTVAWITILSALCGILLLQVFRVSKKIEKLKK